MYRQDFIQRQRTVQFGVGCDAALRVVFLRQLLQFATLLDGEANRVAHLLMRLTERNSPPYQKRGQRQGIHESATRRLLHPFRVE